MFVVVCSLFVCSLFVSPLFVSPLFVSPLSLSFLSYDFGPTARYPVAHAWDPEESRLLVCETYKLLKPTTAAKEEEDSKDGKDGKNTKNTKNTKESTESKESKEAGGKEEQETNRIQEIQNQKNQLLDIEQQAEIEVTTIFATLEHGLLKQDSRPLESGLNSLLGLHVPNLYFVSQPQKNSDSSIAVPRLVRKALRDFAGLDRVDDDIKRALMDFSYFLTIGDMDLAYKVQKTGKLASRRCSINLVSNLVSNLVFFLSSLFLFAPLCFFSFWQGGSFDRRTTSLGEHGFDVCQNETVRRGRSLFGHDGPRQR